MRVLKRIGGVIRRFVATGRFRAAPGPIIERFFGGRDCFFVQVGSHDGVLADPLHELIKANPRWRGIFIEPLDEAFDKLVANYPVDRQFGFEQVAISDSAGEQWFYYVSRETIRETGLHGGVQAVGSLSRDHVLRLMTTARNFPGVKVVKEPDGYLSRKLVRCEPLMSVLSRHRVEHIDVLVIDAESYDYQILRQLDFERFRPKLILYEHAHLGDEIGYARSLLSEQGYRLINCGTTDTMAVR